MSDRFDRTFEKAMQDNGAKAGFGSVSGHYDFLAGIKVCQQVVGDQDELE